MLVWKAEVARTGPSNRRRTVAQSGRATGAIQRRRVDGYAGVQNAALAEGVELFHGRGALMAGQIPHAVRVAIFGNEVGNSHLPGRQGPRLVGAHHAAATEGLDL